MRSSHDLCVVRHVHAPLMHMQTQSWDVHARPLLHTHKPEPLLLWCWPNKLRIWSTRHCGAGCTLCCVWCAPTALNQRPFASPQARGPRRPPSHPLHLLRRNWTQPPPAQATRQQAVGWRGRGVVRERECVCVCVCVLRRNRRSWRRVTRQSDDRSMAMNWLFGCSTGRNI